MVKLLISILLIFSLNILNCEEISVNEDDLQETKNETIDNDINPSEPLLFPDIHFPVNLTIQKNTTSNAENSTTVLVNCTAGFGGYPVEILNSTRFIKLLSKASNTTLKKGQAGQCMLILFYATYCPFSAAAARHFNALARVYADIKMAAIDAMKYHLFNSQNGIVGVPTIILFHNGRGMARYNETEYKIELFAKFISKYTNIEPNGMLLVKSEDFQGPVPTVVEYQVDYCLGLSWAFIIVCGIYFFTKSKYWAWIVETIQNNWREAAQHEHYD